MIDRFKDMRRVRKPKNLEPKNSEKTEKILRKKVPGIHSALAMPDIPAGEDEVSFRRHNNVLRAEWTKSSRNMMVVNELMDVTYGLRRRTILEESMDVETLFEKFPFLQDPDQVLTI